MGEIVIVFGRELKARVRSRAFAIGVVMMPLMILAAVLLPSIGAGGGTRQPSSSTRERPRSANASSPCSRRTLQRARERLCARTAQHFLGCSTGGARTAPYSRPASMATSSCHVISSSARCRASAAARRLARSSSGICSPPAEGRDLPARAGRWHRPGATAGHHAPDRCSGRSHYGARRGGEARRCRPLSAYPDRIPDPHHDRDSRYGRGQRVPRKRRSRIAEVVSRLDTGRQVRRREGCPVSAERR